MVINVQLSKLRALVENWFPYLFNQRPLLTITQIRKEGKILELFYSATSGGRIMEVLLDMRGLNFDKLEK